MPGTCGERMHRTPPGPTCRIFWILLESHVKVESAVVDAGVAIVLS